MKKKITVSLTLLVLALVGWLWLESREYREIYYVEKHTEDVSWVDFDSDGGEYIIVDDGTRFQFAGSRYTIMPTNGLVVIYFGGKLTSGWDEVGGHRVPSMFKTLSGEKWVCSRSIRPIVDQPPWEPPKYDEIEKSRLHHCPLIARLSPLEVIGLHHKQY